MPATATDRHADLFATVFGNGRGRGHLPPSYPYIITDDGIELELVSTVIHGSLSTYPQTLSYRGYRISYDPERRPTATSCGYKWMISGYAHGTSGEVSHHDADILIGNEAGQRNIPCEPDSESGQLFINAPTLRVARTLVDIAHDLGLATAPPAL